MPVGDDGIGISNATIDKQMGLARILEQHVSTCKAIFEKHNWVSPVYQYIDTNAGSGYNEDIGCDGSPVIFLKTVSRYSMQYRAHFIEINPVNSTKLRQRVSGYQNYDVITGDNNIAVPRIIASLPRNSYGLFYSDPNGVPDFEMIAEASRKASMRYVDILIRYAASAVKRVQHIDGKKMLDYLETIHKKYWIVHELSRGDKWQWTFLLGLNWGGLKVWKSQGFHYANSKVGRQIVERLNYTNGERKAMQQPLLLPYISYEEYLRHPTYRKVRQQAIERSDGVCERCKRLPVTEVHHLHYPEWGTFDTVDNLLAVCHQCHCELHGKEN